MGAHLLWFLGASAAVLAALDVLVPSVILRYPRGTRSLRRGWARLRSASLQGDEGIVFQERRSCCGISCIEMLLRKNDVARRGPLVHNHGRQRPLSMLEIADVLRRHSFETRGLRLGTPRDLFLLLKENPGTDAIVLLKGGRAPLMPSRAGGHWVLVETIGQRRAVLLDPFLGRISVRLERFHSWWEKCACWPG